MSDINNKRKENRDTVQWKLMDVASQLEEIESIVNELELTPADENFISNINAVRNNLDFYFSNWHRGTKREEYSYA